MNTNKPPPPLENFHCIDNLKTNFKLWELFSIYKRGWICFKACGSLRTPEFIGLAHRFFTR